MRYEQESFTKLEKLDITHQDSLGYPIVSLIQRSQSMTFHIAFHPHQARDLAQKLIDIANTADACQELTDKAKARAQDVAAEAA